MFLANPTDFRLVRGGRRLAQSGRMDAEQLKNRTRQFALDVVDLAMTIGHDDFATVSRRQLIRAGTGVATNYRAACRSRSSKEFASRLAVVVEEVDECELWLDFLESRGYGAPGLATRHRAEAKELRAIFAKSRATMLRKLRERRRRRSKRSASKSPDPNPQSQIPQSPNPQISKSPPARARPSSPDRQFPLSRKTEPHVSFAARRSRRRERSRCGPA